MFSRVVVLFLLAGSIGAAQELLSDSGFELSSPDGSFPNSGSWLPATAGGEGGSICTTTAGRSGNNSTTNGLWTFTGNVGTDWWVATYQETNTAPGKTYNASAWIRTPPDQPWVEGSQALIRLEFLDAQSNMITIAQSDALTETNFNWTQYEVAATAPSGATRIRFVCYLAKPETITGVSVANFDDCSLVQAFDLLVDRGFEISTNNGAYPFSTDWSGAWVGSGGVIVVNPAAHTGANGLWQFTGTAADEGWSVGFQDLPASSGMAINAGVWVRSAVGEPWAPGTEAYLHVAFFNLAGDLLASHRSTSFTGPNTTWTQLTLTTAPAPTNTARARFSCYLIKAPEAAVQSVANFDDATMVPISSAKGRVSSRALGVPVGTNAVAFELRNTGLAPLTWSLTESVPWLSAPVSSGTVAAQDGEQIVFQVDRTGLPNATTLKGTVTVTAGSDSIPVDVYLETPSPAPPTTPSEVKFFGRQLRVRDRLQNGSLGPAQHYVIKGVGWSPASIGTRLDGTDRRDEYFIHYISDVQLLRAMNVNTVYVFLDFGTDAAGLKVLDYLYHNGIKAIVTTDGDGTGDTNRLKQVVTAYRNHPAVLAWAVGNEWNINLYHGRFIFIGDAANHTEVMAKLIKSLDSHPVVATYGDIDIPNLNPLRKSDENASQPISTERIVNDICPNIDCWGLNIYRGASFGNIFTQWRSITTKPMSFSEFGTDAYRTFNFNILDGVEDEAMQATFNRGLWNEIVPQLSALNLTNICVGGTVFEWCDEWWKAPEDQGASAFNQENFGFSAGHPDSFANEEWFGIIAIDRRTRQSYSNFSTDFGAVSVPSDLDQDGLGDSWEWDLIDRNTNDALTQLSDITPQGDLDSDGINNAAEFTADTDGLSAQSQLRFLRVLRENQNVRLTWMGGIQATQILEARTALTAAAVWAPIFTNVPPTALTNQFLDLNATGKRFFRLKVQKVGPHVVSALPLRAIGD